MAEVHCISIGYPVEMGVDSGRSFIIEIECGKHVCITQSEAEVWTKLLIGSDVKNTETDVLSLFNKGLLVTAKSQFELIFKLSQLRPLRQGVGIYGKYENDDCFFCVVLGDEKYALTHIQKCFWRYSDGNFTIAQITEKMRMHGIVVNECDLLQMILELISAGVIYLRK